MTVAVSEDGRFKSLCFVPYFLIVVFVLACIGTAAGLLAHYGINSIHDEKYTVVDSVLIALAIIIGFSIIGNVVTWSQICVCLYTAIIALLLNYSN